MNANENQIIVYQPNGVMRIDVRFDGETVWLLQSQIAELFSCSLENVRLHLKNIYACGELEKMATSKESLEVRKEGNRSVTRKFLYRTCLWDGSDNDYQKLVDKASAATVLVFTE